MRGITAKLRTLGSLSFIREKTKDSSLSEIVTVKDLIISSRSSGEFFFSSS